MKRNKILSISIFTFRKLLRYVFLIVLLFSSYSSCISAEIKGELMQWHKVILLIDGPDVEEESATFRDYRLNVTFSKGSQKFVIPGHYAADGYAGQTGAKSGNKWRVYFNPNETGEWTYTVSFRTGTLVAVSLVPEAGSPLAPYDGETGSFVIGPSDKQRQDFRARGLMGYVGGHFQQFAGDKSYWLAVGTGSPENLLGGSDFDNISVGENWIEDHIQDWKEGDPTWRAGKGKGVIGAINYINKLGMNTLWLTLMNAYCDAAPTSTEAYPWPTKEVTTE